MIERWYIWYIGIGLRLCNKYKYVRLQITEHKMVADDIVILLLLGSRYRDMGWMQRWGLYILHGKTHNFSTHLIFMKFALWLKSQKYSKKFKIMVMISSPILDLRQFHGIVQTNDIIAPMISWLYRDRHKI